MASNYSGVRFSTTFKSRNIEIKADKSKKKTRHFSEIDARSISYARSQSEAIQQNQDGGLTLEDMEYMDEEDIEDQKPRAPCSGLRKELKECILESDCVKKVKFN